MTEAKRGRPKTAERTIQVQIRLPESLHKQLSKEAKQESLPLGTYIRTILNQWEAE